MQNKRSHFGFTLIEMLIAIAIGAGISVVAYRALSGAILAEEKIAAVSENIENVDRLWQYMSRDLLHVAPIIWKNNRGDSRSALIGTEGDNYSDEYAQVPGEEEYFLQFVRRNRANLRNIKQSNLYMVGYRLTRADDSDSTSIWRDTWGPVDGSDAEPKVYKRRLLDGIKELKLSYLPEGLTRISPVSGERAWNGLLIAPSGNLPEGIYISVDLEGMGEITRLFPLTRSN